MATMSPLRRRMIEDMTLRDLSPSTQQSYIYAIAKFSRHFGCSPDRLSLEQVRAYQLHLIKQKHSWSHLNQVACALRFFYGVTLGQAEAFERIVGGRKPDKLPLVLGADGPLFASNSRFAQSRRPDDRLCGGVARERGRPAEGDLDRQPTHADPHRERQGRQRSLRHAVAAAAGGSARLLEARAARLMAVSGP